MVYPEARRRWFPPHGACRPVQYLCVQCDEQFEVTQGDKPRCPKCLRVHGLRPVDAAAPEADTRSRKWLWLGVVLVAAAVVFAVSRRPDQAKPSEPGAKLAVAASQLHSAAGDDAGLLEPNDAVAAWAKRVAGSAGSASERAGAVVKAIRARAQAQAFVPWSLVEARDAPEPLRPDAVLKAIEKDGARQTLYPLEAVALATAALRTLDVGAFVGVVQAYPGDAAPPDASGRLGYFALVVRDGQREQWFDPFGGRSGEPSPDARAVLDDAQAVAGMLALRALHAQARGDSAAALKLAQGALSLWPQSASARGVRGAVLLGSGGVPEGERELQAALQLRADPPQYNNLAMLRLAQGDADAAAKLVAKALEHTPDYAAAQLTLASVHMASGEQDLARAALERAERLDPAIPALPLTWAQYHMAAGELDQAIARAERAVELRPKNPQVLVMLGRIYREAGRYDEMRSMAQKALAVSSSAQREQVRQLIAQLLGPTALLDSTGGGGVPAPGAADPDHLELSKGSNLLAPGASDGPSLLDGAGDLKAGDDATKLRLGGGSGKLKLNLDE
jgi:Flp pilus assembly protein TadD